MCQAAELVIQSTGAGILVPLPAFYQGSPAHPGPGKAEEWSLS
jgi:hypothetical protein